MADIIEGLKEKRRIIEQFQRTQANQEGQESQLLKQLEAECAANSVEQAEEVLKRLYEEKAQSEKLLEDLDEKMAEIILNAQPGSDSRSI